MPKLYDELLEDAAFVIIEHLPSDVEGEPTILHIPEWPDSIADSISTNFNQQNALSRSAPVFSFINAGPRTVQVAFTLYRTMLDDANANRSNVSPQEGEDYVDLFIRELQSIALPNYHNESKEVEPPQIVVRYGEDVQIEGVVNGGINVGYEKPLIEDGKYAIVSINFTVSETHPTGADDKAQVGSLGTITSTMQDLLEEYM